MGKVMGRRLAEVPKLTIPLANCKRCLHYEDRTIYQVCLHGRAKDATGGQHTTDYMRKYSACGNDMTLFTPKPTKVIALKP